MEHTYKGEVIIGRGPVVTKDGSPLADCTNIENHSPDGLNWGYSGSGAAQLALALMVSEYGEDVDDHPIHYQDLKDFLVARLPHNKAFTFTSETIHQVVGIIEERDLAQASGSRPLKLG